MDQLDHDVRYRDVASPKCREIIQKTCFFLGRYDFQCEGDVLISRGWNRESVAVKAYEWLFTTEEETDARSPGVSEENIWATGEVLPEVGLTFKTSKRFVMIKFMASKDEFESELMRQQLPEISNERMLPMLAHFNSFGADRKIDMMYETHRNDPRFNSVEIGAFKNDIIALDKFLYAIAYALPSQGTLCDYKRRYGLNGRKGVKDLASELAHSLKNLHDCGTLGELRRLKRLY